MPSGFGFAKDRHWRPFRVRFRRLFTTEVMELQIMNPNLSHRSKWQIDQILDHLLGEQVRVAAESFYPVKANGEVSPQAIAARELILPDNSSARLLPVYFEGQLRQFVRRIGVVEVTLAAPIATQASVEGIVHFRDQPAVILRGPAVVRLAYPFKVERIPAHSDNYWKDLQQPRVQFTFPF